MRHSNAKDSNKKVPEVSETSCCVKVINKPESVGRKSLEDSIKDKITTSKEETSQTTAVGQNIVFAKKAYSATSSSEDDVKIQSLPEIRLGGVGSGEVMNTRSLEEKLSAMFEEDKHKSKKPVNNGEDQCGPTLEEELAELFQDKSECDEIPSSTTEVVSISIEDLIAMLEEEEEEEEEETLPNLETTKPKSSESSKAPVKEQPIPEALKRKRGRPPVNRSKKTVLSSKTDKRKPAKTANKVKESALVSRVSERLQLKLKKTRAVRKRKLRGDKFEGTSIKLQEPSQKWEHILKLHRTAISLAKKRKTTTFTTYGLARKGRLLNALKNASIKRKQSSAPLMNIKQTAVKHKGPVIKEDNMDNLPKLTVASTPVLLKSSGNLAKTTLKAKGIYSDTSENKKNTDVKTSHLSVETNFSDSEAKQKNTQKKSEHKVTKPIPLKRLMVTRSKGELGEKQQKKKVQLKSIAAVKVTNKKKIDGNAKTGSVSMEMIKKSNTACGVELRNNDGAVELLVEDANNLTANNMNDRGTGETTMPGKASSASQKNSFMVEVPSGMTHAQKICEMRKAIWKLRTRIDNYTLKQQAEERMVVCLCKKLHFYENNKHVQALMRMLKDAAPGPEQNQDAVFITDLLLGYCQHNDNHVQYE